MALLFGSGDGVCVFVIGVVVDPAAAFLPQLPHSWLALGTYSRRHSLPMSSAASLTDS